MQSMTRSPTPRLGDPVQKIVKPFISDTDLAEESPKLALNLAVNTKYPVP